MRYLLSLLTLLLLGAACHNAPPEPAPTPHKGNTDVLATYRGHWDGHRLTVTPLDADGRVAQHTLTLTTLDASTAAVDGGAPSNGVWVETVATATDGTCVGVGGWVLAGAGVPSPFSGVCLELRVHSGFASHDLARTFIEITSYTYSGPTTPGSLYGYPGAWNDVDFGVSSSIGLWYYDRLGPPGTASTTGSVDNPSDRRARQLFLQTPDSGAVANFTFVFAVKAAVLPVVARLQPAVSGTACVPLNNVRPAISANGQYVAFATTTAGCLGGGTPASQIVRLDRNSGTVAVVSHAAGSAGASNGAATQLVMSADGRYVGFTSAATNLLPSGSDVQGNTDGNGTGADLYLRDMSNDDIYLVSVPTGTSQTSVTGAILNPAISPDGVFVAFNTLAALDSSDANSYHDVYLRDIAGGVTLLITPHSASRHANATAPSVARDGAAVAFESYDNTLVTGDDAWSDVFIWTAATNTITRMSVTDTGLSPDRHSTDISISGDGARVAFQSTATNMITGQTTTGGRNHVYARYTSTLSPALTNLSRTGGGVGGVFVENSGNSYRPWMDEDGRMVVFQSTGNALLGAGTNLHLYQADSISLQDRRGTHVWLIDGSTKNVPGASGVAPIGFGTGWSTDHVVFAANNSSNLTNESVSGWFLYVAPMR